MLVWRTPRIEEHKQENQSKSHTTYRHTSRQYDAAFREGKEPSSGRAAANRGILWRRRVTSGTEQAILTRGLTHGVATLTSGRLHAPGLLYNILFQLTRRGHYDEPLISRTVPERSRSCKADGRMSKSKMASGTPILTTKLGLLAVATTRVSMGATESRM